MIEIEAEKIKQGWGLGHTGNKIERQKENNTISTTPLVLLA